GGLTYTGNGNSYPLSISGNLDLGSSIRSFDITNNNNSTTGGDVQVSAAITGSGGGGINKTNTGTLVLSGSNSFTGGVTVGGGVLEISSDANLGTAPSIAATNITLNNGTLRWTATGANSLDSKRLV